MQLAHTSYATYVYNLDHLKVRETIYMKNKFDKFQEPNMFKLFEKSNYHPNFPLVETFFTNISKSLSILTSSWDGYEEISKKFASISKNGFTKQYELYIPSENDFFVLIHGDMWTNNLFYKYDERANPVEMKFVSLNRKFLLPFI